MGFFKKKLKIKVLYGKKWYYASSISIDKDGELDIEYCYNLEGCVDPEHVHDIIVETDKLTRISGDLYQAIGYVSVMKDHKSLKEMMKRIEKILDEDFIFQDGGNNEEKEN